MATIVRQSKNSTKNDVYIQKILSTPNYHELNIKQLYELCNYPKTLEGFRNLLWREKIKCASSPRADTAVVAKLKEYGEKLASLSLDEIKSLSGYAGSLDGMKNLLSTLGYTYKNTFSLEKKKALENKDEILAKIKALGDTSQMRAANIMKAIGVELQSPGAFLTRFNIPYKLKPLGEGQKRGK